MPSRLDAGGGRRLRQAALDGLADGAYVLWERSPVLVARRSTVDMAAGYRDPGSRPHGARTTLITPPSLAEVLRAGWESDLPLAHPSARTR